MARQQKLAVEIFDYKFYDLSKPSPYSGLYGFHKYWGKKPVEPLRFLIRELTEAKQIVADPFVGSGAIARETVQSNRRFIGGDINPIAIQLTRFFLSPCNADAFLSALNQLEKSVRNSIDDSYRTEKNDVPSHFLWDENRIVSVWLKTGRGKKKIESEPMLSDLNAAKNWDNYQPSTLRPLNLFYNSRINTTFSTNWNDLFTGRALRNIEILLKEIRTFDNPVRQALELTLSASLGQMSNMVFVITSRGKTKGKESGRTEVGSWVIGYWRPKVHFEINVWNCYESRAKKLLRSLQDIDQTHEHMSTLENVLAGKGEAFVDNIGAVELLQQLPDDSVQLLITDPPHGDRIPYLELSEMWNALLGHPSLYDNEIVVSNARQRNKTIEPYLTALDKIFYLASKKLRFDGFLAVMFNSRRREDWRSLHSIERCRGLTFVGAFPLTYSATSVVQDNREGGMKTDYILLFSNGTPSSATQKLSSVPGWSTELPSSKEN